MTQAGIELITAAAVFAAEAHNKQNRKELNEPYIVHPLRVGKLAAKLGQSPEFIAACYLHDVVEDTPVRQATIVSVFPERTAVLVEAMTKWWEDSANREFIGANKDAYYDRIIRTRGAVLLKVLDRVDNLHDFAKMARMSPSNHKWAKRYLDKTLKEFVPLMAALPEHMHAVEEIVQMDAARENLATAIKLFTVACSALEAAL